MANPTNDIVPESELTTVQTSLTTVQASLAALPPASAHIPVGTIMAWHKSLTGTPALLTSWVECSGQVLSDSESVYDGVTIPDLNGEARFLRGSATSGSDQVDAFQGHHHNVPNLSQRVPNRTGNSGALDKNDGAFNTENATTIVTDGVNGTPRIANETRPINMSVVWIIRVK